MESVARAAGGHNPCVDDDPKRSGRPGEGPDEDEPGGGGMSYTARPSRERPEDGGATRDEDQESPDSPEGRDQG